MHEGVLRDVHEVVKDACSIMPPVKRAASTIKERLCCVWF